MQKGQFFLALLVALLGKPASCEAIVTSDNLQVVYQWKQIDYAWPNNSTVNLFPHYQVEENLPLGLEVAGNRLFVTVPKWKQGAAASLNYINLDDKRESPPLMPYPSWEAHQYKDSQTPEIVSTFRIRADSCDRLWVLDTGLVDILGNPDQQAPPALLVYDLKTDKILRKFVIPADQRTPDSLFANIAVEDYSCDDSYAYLGDLGGPGLVVYSWKMEKSWLVKHHFFHPDPQGGEFNVSGIAFQWTDGIFGMALAPMGDGYSTLYFHPLSSTMEFAVSTKLLRDVNRVNMPESSHEFRVVGARGKNSQSSVSFIDPKTGVLFYALTNLNAIACWKIDTPYVAQQQGQIYMDNVTMIFPNDMKIDMNGNIWVLSDRLPTFMYSQLNPEEYNFRILKGSAREVIKDTVCFSDSYRPPKNMMDHGMMHHHHTVPEISGRSGSSGAGIIASNFILTSIIIISLVRDFL